MIAIICSVIVIAGVLFEFVSHRPLQPKRHLKGVQIVPLLLTISVIALVLSPAIGLIAGGAALVLVVVDSSRKGETLNFALSNAWSMVLDETATRISSLGDPLPIAFFAAAASLPKSLENLVDAGAKNYQLTGDFQAALAPLIARLGPGPSTETLRMLASLTSVSTSEAQATLGVLSERHREDHNLTMELQAKLSGAKLARAFVVAVPLFLMAIGVIIGGGIAPYLTRLGLSMSTIALTIITLCWLWADRYLAPLGHSHARTLRRSKIIDLMNWTTP
jgi:hypothetical protein